MFYIAFKFGFVEKSIVQNGKARIQTTHDIREARPFDSYMSAVKFMQRFPNGHHYFAVLQPAAA